jgi:hypothetical protein
MSSSESVDQPGHMSLKDRKAFALKAAYLVLAGANPETQETRAQEYFGKNIDGLASEAANSTALTPLDAFLVDAVERAENAARAMTGTSFDEFLPAVAALRAEIRTIRCDECLLGEICSGGKDDDRIVAEGGKCIREIKAAFNEAVQRAQAEYRCDLSKVQVVLATSGYSRHPAQIPGIDLAVNGHTRFVDGDASKHSVVTLQVASALLDGQSLSALPYVMLHEALCHAYQMSADTAARANETFYIDPLAEGLLDRIAVDLLKMESHVSQRKSDTADMAQRIHLARRSLDAKPRFGQAPQVSLGAQAWDLIFRIYEQDSDAQKAEEDARRLAYDLNRNGWSYERRFKGFSRLRKLLQLKPRDVGLVDLLLRYKNTVDVSDLVEYLTKD